MTSSYTNQTDTPKQPEQKRDFVKKVTFQKELALEKGTFFQFLIEFTNGDKGEYLSKLKEQTAFGEGAETDYLLIPQVHGQKIYYKVKPIQQKSFGKFDREFELYKQRLIVRQHSQKVALELILKALPEQVSEMLKSKDLTPTFLSIAHALESDVFRD